MISHPKPSPISEANFIQEKARNMDLFPRAPISLDEAIGII